MVNQKLISLKIDSNQLDELDRLCLSLGCKRNKLINFAIYMVNSFMTEDFKCRLTKEYQDCLSVFEQVC